MGAFLREWVTPVPGLTQAQADARYLRLIGGALTGLLDLSAAAAGQIKFPTVPNLSADAHTFDAFERGSWTPTVAPSTSGTITLSANPITIGRYIRFANMVVCWARIRVSAVSSPVGNANISGLPFAGTGAAAEHFAGAIWCDGMAATATTALQVRQNSLFSTATVTKFQAGTGLTNAGDWTASTDIQILLPYPVA